MWRVFHAGIVIVLIGCQLALAGEEQSYEFASTNGYKVIAFFVDRETRGADVYYVLKRQDTGEVIRVPREVLTPESQRLAARLGLEKATEKRLLAKRKQFVEVIREFSYDKVDFGTSHAEFKRLFPSAKRDENPDIAGAAEYTRPLRHKVNEFPLGDAAGATFAFVDDQLLCITVMWLAKDSAGKMDQLFKPWKSLLKSITSQCGKADTAYDVEDNSGDVLEWVFPEVERRLEARFEFEVDNELDIQTLLAISVFNSNVEKKVHRISPGERQREERKE